jgi:hypothetical protein
MSIRRLAGGLVFACIAIVAAQSPGFGQDSSAEAKPPDLEKALRGLFGAVGNLFAGKEGTLRELTEKGEYENAADFYIENEKELDAARTGELLAKIAAALNDKHGAGAGAAADRISALPADPAYEAWPSIRAALSEGRELADRYSRIALLQRESYTSTDVRRLRDAIKQADDALLKGADGQFVRYRHDELPPFFEQYPAALTQETRTRLENENREMLAAAHLRRTARQRQWSEPYTIMQRLQLAMEVAKAFPEGKPAALGIALLAIVDGAQKSKWDGAKTGVPAFQASLAELPRRLQALMRQEGFSHVVVVDPTRIGITDVVSSVTERQSQRITGKREEPNPEWDSKRRDLEESERQLSEVETQNQDLQRQSGELARAYSGRGMGALGAVFGSGTGTYLVESAKTKARQAREELGRTPRTVWSDTTQPYRYAVSTRERTLVHQVAFYLVDAKSDVAQRAVFTERDTRRANVVHHIDPNDPEGARLQSSSARELKRLESLGEDALLVTPEQALNRLASSAELKPLAVKTLPAAVAKEQSGFQSEQALEEARAKDRSRSARQELAQYSAAPSRAMETQRLAAAPPSNVPPARSAAATAAADAEARANLCPREMSHLASRMRTTEARSNLGQPVRDMISKAGGVDRAIAMTHAQMREYERTRDDARQSAISSYGGSGPALQGPCRPGQSGIYCSSAQMYFMMEDSILYTSEVGKALSCYKSAGLR